MDNMNIWNNLSRPPKEALKFITGGRLKGMTDINPQWRLKVMTEQFGLIGFGWKYQITEHWHEEHDGQVACFVRINLYIKVDEHWSEPIEGVGGSMLLTKEKNGLYFSDEGYKMALTDALSVAMKQLGVASDIYAGLWDGSKYRDMNNNGVGSPPPPSSHKTASPPPPTEAQQEAQATKEEIGQRFDQPTSRPAPTQSERQILHLLSQYWVTQIKSPNIKLDANLIMDVLWSKLGHYPTLDECTKLKDPNSPFFVPLESITIVKS